MVDKYIILAKEFIHFLTLNGVLAINFTQRDVALLGTNHGILWPGYTCLGVVIL